jgi:hypothetical protein
VDTVDPIIVSGDTADAIDEASGENQVIYTAIASDIVDPGTGVISFSLVDELGNLVESLGDLTINSSTGEVSLTVNPEYDEDQDQSQSQYSFEVVAKDAANNQSATQSVTVNINNVDQVAPTIAEDTPVSIDENTSPNQVIYMVTADDTGDISGGVTYALTSDSDTGLSINSVTGEVSLSSSPDFEVKGSYQFSVIATDAAGLDSDPQSFTVAVNNLDEFAPTITSADAAADVDENSGADQVIYTATADDSLDISAGVTFALGEGHDSALSIETVTDEITGLAVGEVTLSVNPNYESHSQYSFTVIANDGVNPAVEKSVTLDINDLDEVAPTITSGEAPNAITLNPIDENSGTGQVIYTATASDTDDISAGVTFRLADGSDSGLSIDIDSGAVTLIANPDYEDKASYSFGVIATDAAGYESAEQ